MIPPVARVSGFAATARIMVRSDQLEIVMRRLIAEADEGVVEQPHHRPAGPRTHHT